MSTRCRVAVRNPDGSFHSIYGHYDGYPYSYDTGECDAVGQKLASFYTDPSLVEKLIALGDFSVLDRTLEASQFYGRDYKELGVDCIVAQTLDDLFVQAENCGGEWIYIFDPTNQKWSYHTVNNDGTTWLVL